MIGYTCMYCANHPKGMGISQTDIVFIQKKMYKKFIQQKEGRKKKEKIIKMIYLIIIFA